MKSEPVETVKNINVPAQGAGGSEKGLFMTNWEQIADQIILKTREVLKRDPARIPYTTTEPHIFDDQSSPEKISWWTNGFWGGEMWQLWKATGEDCFREAAIHVEEELDRVLMNYQGMDHDSGFRFLPTAVAHYRADGNRESLNRGLLAAANLAGRFNLNGNFIRAWNGYGDKDKNIGWAIIDCMMNLPLLYWASDVTSDPRFTAIALAHADTAMKNFIREDGSVRHIVEFDPVTGDFVRDYGGQGMGEGSSWTRGQAWALYGFALSYRHTGLNRYLETARKVADRFLERSPEKDLMPVDFDQDPSCPWHDSTAAAIAACGLLTLAEDLTEKDPAGAAAYREGAERLLSIIDEKDCDYDPAHDELLTQCTAAYHDERHNFPIIYGDYYYVEAVWKLTGREFFLW